MSEYVLFTDSSCDLPQALASKMQLQVLPLTMTMDGKSYPNTLDEKYITYVDFYNMLPKATEVKTSAVNQHAFETAMEPVLAEGKDILYLGFSSGLSGSCQNAMLAARELEEKYPGRRLEVVDMPLTVLLDAHGGDLYQSGPQAYLQSLT